MKDSEMAFDYQYTDLVNRDFEQKFLLVGETHCWEQSGFQNKHYNKQKSKKKNCLFKNYQ